jgi:predicted RNA binding protein YcfA (HicA-like mRNA interferase family)
VPRRFSSNEVVRALDRIGIVVVRQRGSHLQLRGKRDGISYSTTVPANLRQIPAGTLSEILRQCGLSSEQLLALVEGHDL